MSEETKEKKSKTTVKDLKVVHQGTQIILPVINGKPMTFDEGVEWMQRMKREEEQEIQIMYKMPCSPLDGAVAFQRALSEIYGWVEQVPTPGFFSDKPPAMIGVPISADKTMQVAWGRIQIPGIKGYLATGMETDPHPAFVIGGTVLRKHKEEVEKIADLTKKYLAEKSIYRGSAIKVSFEWMRNEKGFDPMDDAPKFLDLKGITDDDLIFGQEIVDSINIGLFAPIENADACRKYNVPLKRGILLHGPYGTGKTMTAYVSALKAVRNNWTFIYLDSVQDLKRGLDFAAQYAPCVLFAEDIDRVMNGGRSYEMDDMLNTLDGVDTKGKEIITVFTTNHIEMINPAALRMGRLDMLIEVTAPDAEAAEKLVRLYARGLLSEDASLPRIGHELAGQIPAFIREVTERAKISAIARLKGGDIEGKVLEEDLVKAATAMKAHANMLEPKAEGPRSSPRLMIEVPANDEQSVKRALAAAAGA